MIEINEHNFNDFFYDVRRHNPKKGQVMASYRAIADFVDSDEKRDIISLLKTDRANAIVQLMKKFHGATDHDSIRVPIEMCADLLSGMTENEVAEKPYSMTIEYFFYTQKEYIPTDDPHWTCISLRNLTEVQEGDLVVKGKIVDEAEK